MLLIVKTMADLDFAQLFEVYRESICADGEERYPMESAGVRTLWAEQDFYSCFEMFLKDNSAACALWIVDGIYYSALRLERYRDGYLLNSLETAQEARGKGYATNLLRAVVQWLKLQGETKLYSHIDNRNLPSVSVHCASGFRKIMDYAVFLDGSVIHSSSTYLCEIN